MIVVQICDSINWGSIGKIASQIGDLIIENNGDSYIAYGRYKNSSDSCSIKIGNKLCLYYHVLYSRLFDGHGLASIIPTYKFIKKLDEISPDIIHLHQIHGYFLNYKILFKYLAQKRIPIVCTLHDCWLFTGHCSNPTTINCGKYQTLCYKCPNSRAYPKSYLDNSKKNYQLKKELLENLKDKLILVPVSDWLSGVLRHSFLKDCKIQMIHNGIDLDSFRPIISNTFRNKYKVKDKFIILGVASVWTKKKGLQDFFKLRSILSNEYEIIIVGLSKKQLSKLPSNIVGIERTNSVQELAELYSISNVFINPTYEDNYPTVNLEAIACGTPVITYRTGGSPESVSSKVGYVVEQGDLNGIVHFIFELQKLDREKLRGDCRKYAEIFFDKNDCFKSYIELYNKVLNKGI